MLSSLVKPDISRQHFSAPYFIHTDPIGVIHAVCDRMEELMLQTSCRHYLDQPVAQIFSALGDSLLLGEDMKEKGFPASFDTSLFIHTTFRTLHLRWISNPVLERGKILGWQLTGVELNLPAKQLTERLMDQKMARPAHEHKSLYAAIINSMPGIFYLFDENGKYLHWNRQLESASGYDSSQISKMCPQDFVAPEEKAYITSRIKKVFLEGIGDAEGCLLTRDGQKIPHYFTGQRISYQGKTCLIGMGIDISERKRTEEKIKISNERYKLAIKATNDTIWEWNLKSEAPFWGEGLYIRFGHKPIPSMATKGFWESHLHPQERERVVSGIQSFIDSKKNELWSDEYRFRKADGKYAIVNDRGFLVFDNLGNPIRLIGSMQDITEKKALEKKLLRQELNKQKLIAQTMINAQEKERADIGKELDDNINQILSTAKLYLEWFKGNTSNHELVERTIENLDLAIHEIRNISKALVPSSLGDLGLVASIQDLVEAIRTTHKIHVEFYAMGDFEELIDDHRKLMLFRIIQEAVSNVVRHSKAKKLIIELLEEEDEKIIELNISDDGIGFDANTMQTKKGTGLSNIMNRADLFNGKVNIVSAPQKGCKLCIHIPFHNLEKELS